jgi:hypothetical protein
MTFSGQNPDKFGQVACHDVCPANFRPVSAANTEVFLELPAIRTQSGQIQTWPLMPASSGKTHKSLASRQLQESTKQGTGQIQTLPDTRKQTRGVGD